MLGQIYIHIDENQIPSLRYGVWQVVNSNGDIIPPFIFPLDLRLNTEANIKCLKEVVLP